MNQNLHEQRAEKRTFQIRKQEDKESKRALDDFRRHYKEEYGSFANKPPRRDQEVPNPPSVD